MKKFESMYLVDDDDVYQYIAKRTIESTGLISKICVFSNGLEAVQSLRSAINAHTVLPDMIMLDLTMPVLDGWGFLDDYLLMKKAIGKKIWIFVVSSSINPADVERARHIEEVTDYVVKPLTVEKFQDLLRTL